VLTAVVARWHVCVRPSPLALRMTPPSAARSYFKMQIDQFYGACRRHQRWKIASAGNGD
jgi:hypothetical protein